MIVLVCETCAEKGKSVKVEALNGTVAWCPQGHRMVEQEKKRGKK